MFVKLLGCGETSVVKHVFGKVIICCIRCVENDLASNLTSLCAKRKN